MKRDRELSKTGISRRGFARDVALVTAAAVVAPGGVLAQSEKTTTALKPPPEEEGLSAAAKAEAEMNYRAVIEKYGNRLNAEQKKDVHRLLMQQQKSIETVRSFALENGDEPALVLHLEGTEAR